MPEISVKDQIRKLIELQKLDAEIFEIRRGMVEKPALINVLKEQFESKRVRLKELEEKAKSVQLNRKDKELILKEKEDLIIKANAALSNLKTNKEYTAKLTEIETLKADKSIIEEKILLLFDDGDVVLKEIEKEKGVVTAEEKNYLAQKKLVDDEVKIMQGRVIVLESQRKQLIPGVDPTIFARYEAILKNKDGLAIVPVTKNTCGGCYMNFRPQNINVMKMCEGLIECEYCSRIIYLEEYL